MTDDYSKHNIDPANNPADAGIRTTGKSLGDYNPNFANPYDRERWAQEQWSEMQARAAQLSPEDLKTFDLITGRGSGLRYFKNNRRNAIHVENQSKGLNVFIPGIMDPYDEEGPFLIIEAEQFDRAHEIKRLLSRKVNQTDPDDERTVLKEISEEEYYNEHAAWMEKAAKRRIKLEKEMEGPYDAEEEKAPFRINWNIGHTTAHSI